VRRRRTIYIQCERERAIGERVFSSYVCAGCVCVMSLNECVSGMKKNSFHQEEPPLGQMVKFLHSSAP
jgi:hypothetical protein